MGIKDAIKKTMTKGAMKVAQTKVGKKMVGKAMEQHLNSIPEGPQRDAAKRALENLQNMSYEEQQEIAKKMEKLLGGMEMKEDMTAVEQMQLMKKIRNMSPEERKEYEDLARKMMGM